MSLLLLLRGGAAPDLWTADADHFTVDDATNHTADGWHDDPTGYTLSLDAGSYAVTGNALGLTAQRKLTFDAGSYAVSGNALGLNAQRKLTLDAGSYTVTGNDVTLTYSGAGTAYNLDLDCGSYTVTGYDVTLSVESSETMLGLAGGVGGRAMERRLKRLKDDDEVILTVIAQWLNKAA